MDYDSLSNEERSALADSLVKQIKWIKITPAEAPATPGVYAITTPGKKRWLYIGRAVDIQRRWKSKQHPVRITEDLNDLEMEYWWAPVEKRLLPRVENRLIDKYNPQWNGRTSHGGSLPPFPDYRPKDSTEIDMMKHVCATFPQCKVFVRSAVTDAEILECFAV